MEKRFKSRTELASILGIPRRTFSSYNTGHRQVINPEMRKKLFELTGIESYRSEKPNKQEWVQLNEWVNSVVEKPPLTKKDIGLIKSEHEQIIGGENIGELNETEVQKVNATEVNETEDFKEEDHDFDENPKSINGNRPFLDMAFELRNWFNNQHKWNTKQEFADDIGVPRSTMKKIFLGMREPKEEYRRKLYEITQLECFKDEQKCLLPETKKDMKIEDKQLENDLIEVGKSIEQVGQSIEQVEHSIEVREHEEHSIELGEHELSIGEQYLIKDIVKPIERLEQEFEKKDDRLTNGKSNNLNNKSKEKDVVVDDVEKLAKIFYSLARALEPFKRGTPEQRKRVKEKILPQDLGYVMSFMKAMYDEDSFTDFMFFSEYTLKGGGSDSE